MSHGYPAFFDLSTLSGTAVLAFVMVGVLALGLINMMGSAGARAGAAVAGSGESEHEPRPVSPRELAVGNGENGQPILIAVKNPQNSDITVFDVSAGRDFYGPGGPYHVFAAKNASRGLAKMSTEKEDLEGSMEDLTASEVDHLTQWYVKFDVKYKKLGWLQDATVDQIPDASQTISDKKDM